MAVNYAAFMQPRENLVVSGLQDAAQISARNSLLEQERIKQQAAKLQAERAAQFRQAFGQAWQSGNKQAVSDLIGQFPEQFDQIKQAAGFRDEQGAKALGSLGLQLTNAIQGGNAQAAGKLIAANADVLRSAGPGYEPEALLKRLQEDPHGLAKQADLFSLAALGPEQYYKVMGQRADNALQARGQDIKMRGQDIQQAEGAANRANAMSIKQLSMQDSALNRQVQMLGKQVEAETNALRRDELQVKLDAAKTKLEQTRKDTELVKTGAISNMQEAATLAREISDSPQLKDITGTVTTMLPTLSGESQDLINKASRLQSLLTIDNLKLMTGVLTDKDIQFLTNVASGLNVQEGGIKGSVSGVQSRLGEIAKKLESKLGSNQQVPGAPAPQPGQRLVSTPRSDDDLLRLYATPTR